MAWSYNKLWVMLIYKGLNRSDLIPVAGLNSAAIARMGKNLPTTMDNLGKICQAFHCTLDDIVEYIPEETEEES